MICISGTPGTGKSSVLSALSKLGYKCSELSDLSSVCVVGIEDGEKIIDVNCLKKIDFDGIVAGHLSHYMRCDAVIILRSHLKDLENRLKLRGYSKKKIMDNVEAEAIDLIGYEAEEMHPGKVSEILNENLDETIYKILQIIENKKSYDDKIDLSEEIMLWY
ncbi:MAG: adenylate kinase family protein [Thermoplasmata archaeon]